MCSNLSSPASFLYVHHYYIHAASAGLSGWWRLLPPCMLCILYTCCCCRLVWLETIASMHVMYIIYMLLLQACLVGGDYCLHVCYVYYIHAAAGLSGWRLLPPCMLCILYTCCCCRLVWLVETIASMYVMYIIYMLLLQACLVGGDYCLHVCYVYYIHAAAAGLSGWWRLLPPCMLCILYTCCCCRLVWLVETVASMYVMYIIYMLLLQACLVGGDYCLHVCYVYYIHAAAAGLSGWWRLLPPCMLCILYTCCCCRLVWLVETIASMHVMYIIYMLLLQACMVGGDYCLHVCYVYYIHAAATGLSGWWRLLPPCMLCILYTCCCCRLVWLVETIASMYVMYIIYMLLLQACLVGGDYCLHVCYVYYIHAAAAGLSGWWRLLPPCMLCMLYTCCCCRLVWLVESVASMYVMYVIYMLLLLQACLVGGDCCLHVCYVYYIHAAAAGLSGWWRLLPPCMLCMFPQALHQPQADDWTKMERMLEELLEGQELMSDSLSI